MGLRCSLPVNVVCRTAIIAGIVVMVGAGDVLSTNGIAAESLVDGYFTNLSTGRFIVHLGSKSGGGSIIGGGVTNGGQVHAYVAGPSPDRSGDRITGRVSLAGTLEVLLEGEFEPKLGDHFRVMSYGELNGRFEHTKLP